MAHSRSGVTRKFRASLRLQVLGHQRALGKLTTASGLLWTRSLAHARRFIRGYGAAVALILILGPLGGCGSPARDDELARVFQSVQDVPTGPYLELREAKTEHVSSNKASSSVASQSSTQTKSDHSYGDSPAENRSSPPPPSQSTSQPRQPQQVNAAEQLIQAMIIEGARRQQEEKEQQYQRFKKTMDNAATCQACGGTGNYRFVDGSGSLRLQDCPYFRGSGRNW